MISTNHFVLRDNKLELENTIPSEICDMVEGDVTNPVLRICTFCGGATRVESQCPMKQKTNAE